MNPGTAKRYLRRGNGEIIAFLVVGPIFCLFFAQLVAMMMWASAATSAQKAVAVAARAAAVCKTYPDASAQAEKAAESAVVDPNVIDISSSVQLMEGEFKPGKLIKVTCTIKVKKMTPFDFRQSFSSSIPVVIEGDDFGLENLTPAGP